MKTLTWQKPGQQNVAQELIKIIINYVAELRFSTLRVVCPVTTSDVSDFTVGGYTFEVGGKNKSQKQVHDVENVYVVKDDIEYGMRNVVPLWAFGFLY